MTDVRELLASWRRMLVPFTGWIGELRHASTVRADLIAGGADPDFQRKQNEAELREFEDRTTRHRDEQLELEADLAARYDAALSVRADVKLQLVAGGAVDRPPRPAPPHEQPPSAPFTGAVWVSGQYMWSGFSWEWQTGYWAQPPTSTAVWVAPVEILVHGAAVVRPGGWVDKKTRKRVKRRDHRRR